jgi:hydroxymethylpyrimidine/phosphomethylpyrimidine kinase
VSAASTGPHGPPCALTIGGSDSGGGAGIQADLKTFAAHGVYGLSAVTAVTAQNTLEVRAVAPVPPQVVAAQIDAVLDDFGAGAVKIGMLWSAETVRVVAARLRDHPAMVTAGGGRGGGRVPIVLDPVMAAGSGASLLGGGAEEAIAALIEELLPLATLVTPNLPELATLVRALRRRGDGDRGAGLAGAAGGGRPPQKLDSAGDGNMAQLASAVDASAGGGEAERLALARQLAARGPAVLAKGGHDPGPPYGEVVDLLVIPGGPGGSGGPGGAGGAAGQGAERVVRFAAPRLVTRATHGTGCTLSAAIAARLAAGEELAAAVGGAIEYVRRAMSAAPPLGAGAGPLAHFHDRPGGVGGGGGPAGSQRRDLS